MYEQFEPAICRKHKELSDLSSFVKCAIDQIEQSKSIGKTENLSVRHRILYSNFQQLDLSSDCIQALSLIDPTAFITTIPPGRAWFITLGSLWDQLVVQQTIGPIRALSDVAHLNFRRSLFRKSNYCFVTHSFQEYVEDEQMLHEVTSESNDLIVTEPSSNEGLAPESSNDHTFDELLDSKYCNLRYDLDQSLIELSAAQITAENYRILYLQTKGFVDDLKHSLSWRITSPIRFVARKLNTIKKHIHFG
jgi:hypothetical protein